MPSSGVNVPSIGERLFPVPLWVTAMLFLLITVGTVSGILLLARRLAKTVNGRM